LGFELRGALALGEGVDGTLGLEEKVELVHRFNCIIWIDLRLHRGRREVDWILGSIWISGRLILTLSINMRNVF
jgi:hypothetical protein